MREPDWFLRWFMYCLLGAFALICLLAAQVYANSTWDEYLKEEVVGDKTVWYDNSILITAPYRALDPAGVEISIYDRAPGVVDYTKLTLVIDENPTPCCATSTPFILVGADISIVLIITLIIGSFSAVSTFFPDPTGRPRLSVPAARRAASSANRNWRSLLILTGRFASNSANRCCLTLLGLTGRPVFLPGAVAKRFCLALLGLTGRPSCALWLN